MIRAWLSCYKVYVVEWPLWSMCQRKGRVACNNRRALSCFNHQQRGYSCFCYKLISYVLSLVPRVILDEPGNEATMYWSTYSDTYCLCNVASEHVAVVGPTSLMLDVQTETVIQILRAPSCTKQDPLHLKWRQRLFWCRIFHDHTPLVRDWNGEHYGNGLRFSCLLLENGHLSISLYFANGCIHWGGAKIHDSVEQNTHDRLISQERGAVQTWKVGWQNGHIPHLLFLFWYILHWGIRRGHCSFRGLPSEEVPATETVRPSSLWCKASDESNFLNLQTVGQAIL